MYNRKPRGSFGHEPLLAFPRPEGLGTFFLIILPAPVFIMSLNSGVMVLVNGSVGDPSLIPPPQPEIVEPNNTRTSKPTARFIDVYLGKNYKRASAKVMPVGDRRQRHFYNRWASEYVGNQDPLN
jgi:hypothetical protein